MAAALKAMYRHRWPRLGRWSPFGPSRSEAAIAAATAAALGVPQVEMAVGVLQRAFFLLRMLLIVYVCVQHQMSVDEICMLLVVLCMCSCAQQLVLGIPVNGWKPGYTYVINQSKLP